MRASILTIGNELLSGKTINTNASWISKKFSSIGVSVNSHLTIADESTRINDTLNLMAIIVFVLSFIFSIIFIHFLISWVRKSSLLIFILYRLIFGTLLITLFLQL